MDVIACYRTLLCLYPEEFRREFSGEMLHVFDQRARTGCAARNIASLLFVVREFFGIVKGAQMMWIEKMVPLRRQDEPALADPQEDFLTVAEIRKLRAETISRMVQAIATHDFPSARRYSEEEIRLQTLLRERGLLE